MLASKKVGQLSSAIRPVVISRNFAAQPHAAVSSKPQKNMVLIDGVRTPFQLSSTNFKVNSDFVALIVEYFYVVNAIQLSLGTSSLPLSVNNEQALESLTKLDCLSRICSRMTCKEKLLLDSFGKLASIPTLSNTFVAALSSRRSKLPMSPGRLLSKLDFLTEFQPIP